MYVRCESCHAVFFESDGALTEGQQLPCVRCGARIVVALLSSPPPARDLWTIVTSEGLSLAFSNEAELVSAILSGAVRAGDVLIGGDAPSTQVELVPELTDYFRPSFQVERTMPYGLDAPEPLPRSGTVEKEEATRDSAAPERHSDSLEQALLELAGDSVRYSRPSVFEPGMLDEPPMAPRRPSEPAPRPSSRPSAVPAAPPSRPAPSSARN